MLGTQCIRSFQWNIDFKVHLRKKILNVDVKGMASYCMFYQLLRVQHSCSSTQSWGSVLPSIGETRDQNCRGIQGLVRGDIKIPQNRMTKTSWETLVTCL